MPSPATTGAGRPLVLVNALLFDGTAETSIPDQGIWIGEDGTVQATGPSDDMISRARAHTPGVRVVDLDGDTVLPGLINSHVHLALGLPGPLADSTGRADSAELAFLMADSARRTLRSGVTTVRLVGEPRFVDIALRSAIDAGAVDGPRIFTAGQALCCTGGHGHDLDGLETDGPEGFRRATREQLRAGVDLIKVCVSGGIASAHARISTPQLTDAEMAAVIDTAHDWGRKVTAHAGPAETIARAVRLGLDCVEHGYDMDSDVTDLMAARDVWYVPTLCVSRCEDFLIANNVPSWMIDRALGAGPRHRESARNALRSGVSIMMGSDMPPYAPFDDTTASVRELEFLVEAGMSALEALRSATVRPARWLGADASLGTLEPGKQADLVVTTGDPAHDISALRGLHLVIKGGVVHRDDLGRIPSGARA
ncbi:amidohydrolase family protein [Streptomyces sp. SID3343]|uniref:amidohydrolase family protein n=1 Tax=Streptomyces sp. SID3343 TaxID=2690260 RepID=UPI001369A4AE|nr:amidohydrolase family protein [Streptomyces sp. SID3343]MYW02210.1 amidohydrolase family protein [Streptomyces sp. SID3343]